MDRLWTRHFILLTFAMLFLGTGFYFLLPTLPLYIRQLGGSEASIGFVVGVFTLSAVVFRLLAGGLLDRYGRRLFMLAGLLFFVFSMYAYTWASGIAILVLLRILHGASWALSTTSLGTTITDVIPERRRGEGMGWYGVSMTVAMAIGPLLGTWVLATLSFHRLFQLAAVLSVIALALAFAAKVPFQPRSEARRAAFFESSMMPVMLIVFLSTVSYGGITTFLPLYAESIEVNVGTFFMVYAISLTLTRPVAGKLSDRYGEVAVTVPALLIAVLALVVISLSSGLPGIILSAILYGIGFGSSQPAFQSIALRLASPDRKGVANATFFTAFDLGIGLGSILLGWISRYVGYPGIFTISAISVACSLVIFWLALVKKLDRRVNLKV